MAVRSTLLLQFLPTSCNHGAIGKSVISSIQEGVRQGDLHSMLCFGIGILPLIRMLRVSFLAAKQQCFADDGTPAGKFADIRAQFERLHSNLVPTTDTFQNRRRAYFPAS